MYTGKLYMNEPSSAWSQNEHTGLLPLTSWTFKESAHAYIERHILHFITGFL